MHQTLNENFIGTIDSVKKEGKFYHVKGWVVPLIFADSCGVSCDGFISITPEERPDIYKFYREEHINYLRCGFNIILEPKTETVNILVNGEITFTIRVEILESVLISNNLSSPEIIVVDNFYKDPDKVRDYALTQKFVSKKECLKGERTLKSFIPSWIKETFERHIGRPIKEFTGPSGIFQYFTAEDRIVHRIDEQEYAAVIYLSPGAPLTTGFSNFKSKITGLTHSAIPKDTQRFDSSVAEINQRSFKNNFYDRHNLESVDCVANIYNRLVIYNSKALHASTGYFGSDKENSQLTHVFFFNC